MCIWSLIAQEPQQGRGGGGGGELKQQFYKQSLLLFMSNALILNNACLKCFHSFTGMKRAGTVCGCLQNSPQLIVQFPIAEVMNCIWINFCMKQNNSVSKAIPFYKYLKLGISKHNYINLFRLRIYSIQSEFRIFQPAWNLRKIFI